MAQQNFMNLSNYINEAQARGISRYELDRELLQFGHSPEAIEQAWREINKSKTAAQSANRVARLDFILLAAGIIMLIVWVVVSFFNIITGATSSYSFIFITIFNFIVLFRQLRKAKKTNQATNKNVLLIHWAAVVFCLGITILLLLREANSITLAGMALVLISISMSIQEKLGKPTR